MNDPATVAALMSFGLSEDEVNERFEELTRTVDPLVVVALMRKQEEEEMSQRTRTVRGSTPSATILDEAAGYGDRVEKLSVDVDQLIQRAALIARKPSPKQEVEFAQQLRRYRREFSDLLAALERIGENLQLAETAIIDSMEG